MKKLVTAALFSTLFSVSAMAGEATVLTSKAMDEVTAGRVQINKNYTSQYAVAVAYGGCAFSNCKFSGNANAYASNYNSTYQKND